MCVCVCLFVSEGGEVCIIERLFSSSLVAVVELAHPRKLRACHFKVQNNMYIHLCGCVGCVYVDVFLILPSLSVIL